MRCIVAFVSIFIVGCSLQEPAATPIGSLVQTSAGAVSGITRDGGLKEYMGIPYAAPPIGPLRWAPPAAVESWEGTIDASEPGPACMQPQGMGGDFYGATGFEMSEDCLLLNVHTRAESEEDALPVMVWIHGGALVTGSGSEYPGELLTSKGVVLVTINYRLGRFGFNAHELLSQENPSGVSGNQGLRDQIFALEWVRDNISKFGGNPQNVTIFGESAGSLSVSLLQASPLAKGLFHRVIGQSGGAFQPMAFRAEARNGHQSAESIGADCAAAMLGDSADEASLEALRAVPAASIIERTMQNAENPTSLCTAYDSIAIVDGEVIPEEVQSIFNQGLQSDVPTMIGSNADEATTFLPMFKALSEDPSDSKTGMMMQARIYLPEVLGDLEEFYPTEGGVDIDESWSNMFSDVLFTYPMRVWSRHMEEMESDAYLYWFTWAPPVENSEQYGAFHAGELGYIFGNLDLFGAKPTAKDKEFSELMASIWTQFAKTGNPNGKNLPQWDAYSVDNESYMELGIDTGQKSQLRLGEMELIERAWRDRRAGGAVGGGL